MILNKVFDGLLELLDRVMIASLDLLLTELGKPALDLIDPRTVGWGKVQVERGRLASQLRTSGVLWVA